MNGKTVQVEGIKVKNTFIDFDAEDEDDVPSAGVALSKRQFSEPAPMGRQMTALRQCSSGMHAQMEAVGEEEQDDEQDGEDADLNGTSPLNRQLLPERSFLVKQGIPKQFPFCLFSCECH
ncbi:unnamed protein product [Durusdinium trenchii]|uniref:Uncharacterized protein n=1 Tax=Durusdinium trenchii TaxID=1381693 RepID=A0ABP0N3J0_9DINO